MSSSTDDLSEVLTKLDQEEARVSIKLEFRRFRKLATVIEGLNLGKEELKTLTTKLKKRLATGGTTKDETIILQGDHRKRAADLLVEEGFSQESIDVS